MGGWEGVGSDRGGGGSLGKSSDRQEEGMTERGREKMQAVREYGMLGRI